MRWSAVPYSSRISRASVSCSRPGRLRSALRRHACRHGPKTPPNWTRSNHSTSWHGSPAPSSRRQSATHSHRPGRRTDIPEAEPPTATDGAGSRDALTTERGSPLAVPRRAPSLPCDEGSGRIGSRCRSVQRVDVHSSPRWFGCACGTIRASVPKNRPVGGLLWDLLEVGDSDIGASGLWRHPLSVGVDFILRGGGVGRARGCVATFWAVTAEDRRGV